MEVAGVLQESPEERRLLEDKIRLDKHMYAKRGQGQAIGKLKVLRLAKMIKDKAKRRGRNIQKVKLGSKVKTLIGDPSILKHLGKYLEDKHLDSMIAKLKSKLKHRKPKADKIAPSKASRNESALARARQPPIGFTRPKRDLKGKLAAFNYLPGPTGPFGGIPPMMMNPLHMHPPLKITINRVPDKSFASKMDPVVLQEVNLKTHYQELQKIKQEMTNALGTVSKLDDTVRMTMLNNKEELGRQIRKLNNVSRL